MLGNGSLVLRERTPTVPLKANASGESGAAPARAARATTTRLPPRAADGADARAAARRRPTAGRPRRPRARRGGGSREDRVWSGLVTLDAEGFVVWYTHTRGLARRR